MGTARSSSRHFQNDIQHDAGFCHKIPPLFSFLREFASKFVSVSPSNSQNWQVRGSQLASKFDCLTCQLCCLVVLCGQKKGKEIHVTFPPSHLLWH